MGTLPIKRPGPVRHTNSSGPRSSSRRRLHARVLAKQASQARAALHRSDWYNWVRPRHRSPQLQAPVWSASVVVLDPLPHHAPQVSTPDDQDPVQALSATRTDLPFHVRVRPRCRDRGPDHPYAGGLKDGVAGPSVLGVVIVDYETDRRSLQLPDQVPALLSDPVSIGIRRQREPDDRPAHQLHI